MNEIDKLKHEDNRWPLDCHAPLAGYVPEIHGESDPADDHPKYPKSHLASHYFSS
jgi:hypothetical protein